MHPPQASQDMLRTLCTSFQIPFSLNGNRFEVHGDLMLGDVQKDALTLPQDLVVQGDLTITSHAGILLPRRLVVQGSLFLFNVQVEVMPEYLSLGGDLLLAHTRISILPAGLNVPGYLDLSYTPIRTLPDGLNVGGELDLSNSHVTHFPPDMQVSGVITPPGTLHDIRNIIEQDGDRVVLSFKGAHHQRMHTQERLQAFPDLARVVASMEPHHQLRLDRNLDGGFIARFENLA